MVRSKNTDFGRDREVYKVKDASGKPCFLVVDNDLYEVRIMAKNPEYKKRRKALDTLGYSFIGVQEYLEVVKISPATKKEIETEFPGYAHPAWEIF